MAELSIVSQTPIDQPTTQSNALHIVSQEPYQTQSSNDLSIVKQEPLQNPDPLASPTQNTDTTQTIQAENVKQNRAMMTHTPIDLSIVKQEQKRVEDTVAGPVKGLGGSYHALGLSAELAAGGSHVIYDKLKSLVTGKLTTESEDEYFKNVVQPTVENQKLFQPPPDAGVPEKLANGIGNLVGMFSQIILTGGGAAAELTPEQVTVGNILRNAGQNAYRSMQLPAVSSAINEAQRVKANGGTDQQAGNAAAVIYLTNISQGMLPLSAPGGPTRRVATGAVSGMATGELGREAQNAVSPANMQAPFDPTDVAINAIQGGAMGGLMGPRAEPMQQPNSGAQPSSEAPQTPASGPAAEMESIRSIKAAKPPTVSEPYQAENQPSTKAQEPLSPVTPGKGMAENGQIEPSGRRAQPRGQDRRVDLNQRKNVADMSPDELRNALLTSDVTGLGNRRAYEESPKKPMQASIDADSLKWVNDNMSPESGDYLLRAIGEALGRESPDSYHISGDEFMLQGDHEQQIHDVMARVQDHLKDAVIRVQRPNGDIVEKRGIEVTYGTGQDKNTADQSLKQSKRAREAAGLRAGRGEEPKGISKIPAEGQQDNLSYPPEEQKDQVTNKTPAEAGVSASGADKNILERAKGKTEDAFDSWVRGRFGKTKFADLKKSGQVKRWWDEMNSTTNSGESGSKSVDEAAHEAATSPLNGLPEPTEAMKAAGNYKVGKVSINGLNISIENPKGSVRSGADKSGRKWSQELQNHYGYITGVPKGKDGDHMDVFLGEHPEDANRPVFVIDQVDPKTRRLDEHKIILGDPTEEAARQTYLANYEKGWKGIGGVKQFTLDEFKDWLKNGDTTKRVAEPDAQRALKAKTASSKGAPHETRSAENAVKPAWIREGNPDEASSEYTKKYGEFAFETKQQAETYAKRLELGESGLWKAQQVGGRWRAVRQDEMKSARTETPPEKTISDFGQKIEGARKDYAHVYAEKMKDAEGADIAAVPLSHSWPEPNYQGLLDEGTDPWTVGFIRAARDEIPTKPQSSWKIKGWVEKVKMLRDFSSKLLNGDISKEKVQSALDDPKFKMLKESVGGRANLYEAIGHDVSLKGIRVSAGQYSIYKGHEYKPPKIIWTVERKAKKTAFSNFPQILSEGDTYGEAVANFKKKAAELASAPQEAKHTKFLVWTERGSEGDNKIKVGIKAGRNYIPIEEFASVKDARQYIADHYDDLSAKLKKMKEIPYERRETNNPRVGVDHRNGADVTPEQFQETFGFRGGQFGNTILKAQSEARQKLNETYDALLDMAGILDVTPKALSLNGDLAIAFGARGTGGTHAAAAHYEPSDTVKADRVVINLTRKRGAGSLAHEWWHALDNYFTRLRGQKGKSEFLTESAYERGEGVRPEIVDAFKRVIQTVNNAELRQRSQRLDRTRTKPYWSTGREMTARAFESYVIEKLRDQGASNDYLANIVSPEYWKAATALGMEKEGTYPYPEAAEIPAVREAFDHFFKTVETKETDQGTAMFSRLDYVNEKKRPAWWTTGEPESLKVGPTAQGVMGKILTEKDIGVNSETLNALSSGNPVGISKDAALPIVARIAKRLSLLGKVRILVHENEGDLYAAAPRIKAQAEKDDATGHVHAVFDPRTETIHLVASKFSGALDIEKAILHEAYGHFGAKRLLGQDYTNALNHLYLKLGGDSGIRRLAEKYDINMDSYLDTASGRLAAGERSKEQVGAYLADELLAKMQEGRAGEELPQRIVRAVQEFIGAVRNALGKMGFVELSKVTDADLAYLLRKTAQRATTGGRATGEIRFSRTSEGEPDAPAIFYSALTHGIKSIPQGKASPDQWKSIIKNMKGVKPEEVEWSGINEWLDGQKGSVAKADLLDHVRSNEIHINEVELGGVKKYHVISDTGHELPRVYDNEADAKTDAEKVQGTVVPFTSREGTKFSQYTTPGGENYRELLLTLPSRESVPSGWKVRAKGDGYYEVLNDKGEWQGQYPSKTEAIASASKRGAGVQDFKSPHFDQPNILAHVRFDERTDSEGRKVLHIAEIQSDWHQKGRKEGYARPGNLEFKDVKNGVDAYLNGERMGRWDTKEQAIHDLRDHPNYKNSIEGIPDAPFKTTWPMLAMKRMIRYASEKGFDAITWDTGTMQAERYDLSKQVDNVKAFRRPDGTYDLSAKSHDGSGPHDFGNSVKEEKLADYVGKDLAEKIARQPDGWHKYEGADLKVGGEGMNGFYDKILPSEINKYVKKWGGKVGETTIYAFDKKDGSSHVMKVPSIDITPAMRESVMGGQPMFTRKQAETAGEGSKEESPIRPLDKIRSELGSRLGAFGKGAGDIANDIQAKVAPMAAGNKEFSAYAKDFANRERRANWEWQRIDTILQKNFKPEERATMGRALDEQSVADQTGQETDKGLSTLNPEQRAVIDKLQEYGKALWKRAQDIGMVQGEGLPSYMPRMIVNLDEGGAYVRLGDGPKSPRDVHGLGGNLSTTTANLKHRNYLTAEETEAAAKAKFGEGATLVRDIRALPLALAKFERAIAGRELVQQIKDFGKQIGEDTVSAGERPGFVSINHPALKQYRPRFETGEDGKAMIVKDAEGNPIFDKTDLYIRKDLVGPLKAVLTSPAGATYKAFMSLKGKAMSMIMYSPMIHNAVEWGRALPIMPGKVATGIIYFQGNKAKHDPEIMRHAIDVGGLVPIGKYAFMQDITDTMNEPDIRPGRSLTAKAIGGTVGLANRKAGEAVKRGIDAAGDFWHNTLLWDRVGDLQAGIYVNMRDSNLAKGMDDSTATRVAAHFANRFAGALPKEAMSDMSRKIGNFVLFSRTFTLGNMAVMKDAVKGMPGDIKAQILRDGGKLQLQLGNSVVKRKAAASIAIDMAFSLGTVALIQNIFQKLNGEDWDKIGREYLDRWNAWLGKTQQNPLEVMNIKSVLPQYHNEPGKENRSYIGKDKQGTALYLRNPSGKIGEEFGNYLTQPLEQLRNKEGTVFRPITQTLANDKGFGRKIYSKYDPMYKEISDVLINVVSQQFPTSALTSAKRFVDTGNTPDLLNAVAPLVGITFSKGAPGGPAVGEIWKNQEMHQAAIVEAMPKVNELVKNGDIKGAVDAMLSIGMTPAEIKSRLSYIEQPASRLGKGLKRFEQTASPDERQRMQELMSQ